MDSYIVGHGRVRCYRQCRGGFRLRWSRAAPHPGSGGARGGRATPAYLYATAGRYSDLYGYHVADAYRYAAGNPNGAAFPKVRCYALFTHPNVPADAHNNEHANAPADADAGSYTYTDLACDDL